MDARRRPAAATGARVLTHRWPAPETPARVVVLGASGFVGRRLVRYLGELQVTVLGLSSRDVDLLDPEAVATLGALLRADDALVLTSALTPDKGRDAATMMKNLVMGHHVSRVLEKSPCAHVVYVSSDAVYEDSVNPVRETSCRHPSTLYGLMHVVRERVLAEAVRGPSTPYAILRSSLLFGPDDTHNSYGPNRFFRTALGSHKITLFGNGEEKRDHVYVEDMVRLAWEVLNHRSEGVLNVATGASRSFFEVASTIQSLSSNDPDLEFLPRSAPITHRHFDISETIKAFPSFRFTGFAEAVGATLRAMTEVS